ncbi:MAG TPA: DUF72 domain-containing protein [Solirubrobacteraceae bacterium]|nr:DUF72 domain-containing protein [Solirubrobacteraceae bacterium]
MRRAHVGCSGWNYRSWRPLVYPQGLTTRDWLSRYAQLFDTVEVNSTFYRLAKRDAVARWVTQTQDGFVFAVKASRYLTHIKRLSDMGEGIARFYAPLEPLIDAGRLGPVLWQLPETFHRDDERLASALEQLPRGRHAFEFRHASWFTSEVYALLRRHRAALVLGDHPQRPFQTHEPTASWDYVRLHYGARGRRGNYSERELEEWARRLHRWRSEREQFVYLNNDWEAFAPRNARWLGRRLAELAQGGGR